MTSSAIIWGLSLGVGSALHCAGMCGPIGCAFLSVTDAGQPGLPSWARLALAQSGRIFAYVLLGLVSGAVGASFFQRVDLTAAHNVLQWIAAGFVVWLGLSTARLVPRYAGLDRVFAPVAGTVARARFALSQGGPERDLVSGLIWGLTPCPMVYAALFNSALIGSREDAMVMMLVFGLTTSVPVMISSLTLYRASKWRQRPGHIFAGLLTAGAGIIAFLLTAPFSPFCITG